MREGIRHQVAKGHQEEVWKGGSKSGTVDPCCSRSAVVAAPGSDGWGMVDALALGTKDLDRVGSHLVLQSHREDRLASALYQRARPEFFGGILIVHGIQPVCRDDEPGVYQPVQRASALRQVGIVGIIRADPIQDQVQAVRKIGHAGSQSVQIESVLDVGSLHLAKHFVSLESAEPLNPRLIVPRSRGILVVCHCDETVPCSEKIMICSQARANERLVVVVSFVPTRDE
mmetsp:Transcript_29965/g.70640  ORF Transcript_29965/g.70640 Transcript_29965/m.70640 type:complete len:229 (-) Transcript_29965:50-736(-)